MNVTYISHSGFTVELPAVTLLFDYYKGELPAFAADKPLYVFASHSHGDHFVPQIFDLALSYPQVHFILSHDIWMMRKKHIRAGVPEERFESATYMRAHETRQFFLTAPGKALSASSHPHKRQPLLTVTTLRSTDMGVAFLIECDGLRIYHAGDLHWWLWPGDTKQAANNMTANYQNEIGHLREALSVAPLSGTARPSCEPDPTQEAPLPHLDLAFLPLDPRLEHNYALGIEYFLQKISVQHVFPMHMWDDYEVISRYQAEHASHHSTIYRIHEPGESWHIETH